MERPSAGTSSLGVFQEYMFQFSFNRKEPSLLALGLFCKILSKYGRNGYMGNMLVKHIGDTKANVEGPYNLRIRIIIRPSIGGLQESWGGTFY